MIIITTFIILSIELAIANTIINNNNIAISKPLQKNSKTNTMTKTTTHTTTISTMLDGFKHKHPHEPTFLQAVDEMSLSLASLFSHPTKGSYYQNAFRIMLEPDRIISFKVPWMDDKGTLQINTGYRVEFSSALGPYKGGLRFHPTVNIDILKSLAFEQTFKNALTGLPMGGGKGGSDFDPKGKSQGEVLRFCVSFMTELHRYVGVSTDVPAGDIGVGGRELGYMYGQYKRLTNKHGEGVLTGKPITIGGSYYRPEATGFGLVYIAQLAIEDKLKSNLNGAKCVISGSGNVAQHAAKKLIELGAKVMTMSDSNGVLVFADGMTEEDWHIIAKAKQIQRIRLSEIEDSVSGYYISQASPWSLPLKILSTNGNDDNELSTFDYAFPCATQNEINKEAIMTLITRRRIRGIFEGANIPITLDGQSYLREYKDSVLYIPGKAANAGGVGVSGFEISQNVQRLVWDSKTVDEKLKFLMKSIYNQLVDVSAGDSVGTLESGANQAGFLKVVKAMDDLGYL